MANLFGKTMSRYFRICNFWLDGVLLLVFITLWNGAAAKDADVSLGDFDSGFFLKPLSDYRDNKVTQLDRFFLTDHNSPTLVRSTFGPFVAHTSVPNSLFIKDSTFSQDSRSPIRKVNIAASLLSHQITKKNPSVKVLFQVENVNNDAEAELICITVHVRYANEVVSGTCNPLGKENACVVDITLLPHWWRIVDDTFHSDSVAVDYSVNAQQGSICFIEEKSSSETFLSNVPMLSSKLRYEDVKEDNGLVVMNVPKDTLYPGSKFYVPVYLSEKAANLSVYAVVIRARTRNGLRVASAHATHPDDWKVSVDQNSKRTSASVTAFTRIKTEYIDKKPSVLNGIKHILTWVFEVDTSADVESTLKILWSMQFILDSRMTAVEVKKTNEVTKLKLHSDEIESLVPLTKTRSILNTAVLDGRIIRQPLKVFLVTKAGKVSDVTSLSTCSSSNEDILQVTSSCTAVYLDGTETDSSNNVTVVVKYVPYVTKVESVVNGTVFLKYEDAYLSFAEFQVWLPELPLDIYLSDSKLSLIKRWKTGDYKRRDVDVSRIFEKKLPVSEDKRNSACHLRHQQSRYEIYARFKARHSNVRKDSYFLSKKAWLKMTCLLKDQVRLSDTTVASLLGDVIHGQTQGRTELQVVSPITGRVIGAREIRVTTDKVVIDSLRVSVVSGLNLSLHLDPDVSDSFIARSTLIPTMHYRFQESIVDLEVIFSDDSITYLTNVADEDVFISAISLNPSVIKVSSSSYDNFIRITAVGQGKGDLLKVSLNLGDACQRAKSTPLATALAYVNVDFSKTPETNKLIELADFQNDDSYLVNNYASIRKSGMHKYGPEKFQFPWEDIEKSNSNDASLKAYSEYRTAPKVSQQLSHDGAEPSDTAFSPLEIGMYVLLGIFCLAIMVFVINCVVFAMRYRRKRMPSSDTFSDAHDWVYVGRATLERQGDSVASPPGNLLPESTFIENNADLSQHTPPDTLNNNCNRNSTHSYPGSEISIRLMANPQAAWYDDMQWNYEAAGLTYEQLKDYFDNLKESTA